jgi:hypothetical protein
MGITDVESFLLNFPRAWIRCGGDTKSKGGDFKETDTYTPYQPTPNDSVIITGKATYVGPADLIADQGEVTVGDKTVDNVRSATRSRFPLEPLTSLRPIPPLDTFLL